MTKIVSIGSCLSQLKEYIYLFIYLYILNGINHMTGIEDNDANIENDDNSTLLY